MPERVDDNPSGRALPPIGKDRYLIDRFLQGTILLPKERQQLGEEVIEELKREKFHPTNGAGKSFPELTEMAKEVGRVTIQGKDVWASVHKAFGSKSALRRRFFTEVGFAADETEEAITDYLANVTGVSKKWAELKAILLTEGKLSFSSADYHLVGRFVYVLDNIDNRSLAYGWPFLGVVSNRQIITPDLYMHMAYEFIQKGIRPWRIAHFQGGEDEIKQETVAVFLAQTH